MCVLSIKVPIRKNSGNLFNDPRMSELFYHWKKEELKEMVNCQGNWWWCIRTYSKEMTYTDSIHQKRRWKRSRQHWRLRSCKISIIFWQFSLQYGLWKILTFYSLISSRQNLNVNIFTRVCSCSVGWGCRIHWLHFWRGVRPHLNNPMVKFM